jgi:hypothetical protein
MLDSDIASRLKAIPFRLRCAVLLGLSERLIPELGVEAQNFARRGLSAAWDWLGGKAVPARGIYDNLNLMNETLRTTTPVRENKAIAAIGYALHYVSWRAFGLEIQLEVGGNTSDPAVLRRVPSDLFDVTDEHVDEALRYASTIDPDVLEWSSRALEGIGPFTPDAGESLGEHISRKDLGLPG